MKDKEEILCDLNKRMEGLKYNLSFLLNQELLNKNTYTTKLPANSGNLVTILASIHKLIEVNKVIVYNTKNQEIITDVIINSVNDITVGSNLPLDFCTIKII